MEHSWEQVVAVARADARMLVAAFIGVSFLLTSCGDNSIPPGPLAKPVRQEFKDKFGRACVAEFWAGRTTLDCSWPPPEDRLRDALKSLAKQAGN